MHVFLQIGKEQCALCRWRQGPLAGLPSEIAWRLILHPSGAGERYRGLAICRTSAEPTLNESL